MKSKAAVFDYEGTVGEKSLVWMEIEQEFGVDRDTARERYLKYAETGEWDWEKYNDVRIDHWNSNLEAENAEEIFDQLLEEHFEEKGVRKHANWLVDFLHEKGFETYLISHAPDSYSRKGMKNAGIQNHVDTLEIEMDEKVREIREKQNHDKREFVENLRKKGREVWFFGNGANDFEAARAADQGFIMDNLEDLDYGKLDNVYTGDLEQVCSEVVKRFERGSK